MEVSQFWKFLGGEHPTCCIIFAIYFQAPKTDLQQYYTDLIWLICTVFVWSPAKNNPKKHDASQNLCGRKTSWVFLTNMAPDRGSYELRFRYADRYSEIRTAGQRQLRLTVNGAPWVKFEWRLGGGKGSRCVLWPRNGANFCGLFNVFYEYFWYMWSHILCLIHDLVRI